MIQYPKLSAIVAKSRNNVIGVEGGLPWHLSSDLQFFKKTTLRKPVLMGRVTWEGLPFPLPGRANLVLTRNTNYMAPPAEIFTNMNDMIGRAFEIAGETNADEVMIVGGAKVYAETLPLCDRLYVTDVHVELSGDAYFPEIKTDIWKLTSETEVAAGPSDDHDFTIRVYDRVK